jgi:hypothetical protein
MRIRVALKVMVQIKELLNFTRTTISEHTIKRAKAAIKKIKEYQINNQNGDAINQIDLMIDLLAHKNIVDGMTFFPDEMTIGSLHRL